MLVGDDTNFSFRLTQIVNTDGSNLEPDTDVGPVDLWMHSLFSDVSVSLNEKLVSGPLGSMSVLFAPNSHVPHWSESVVLQTNPIPISYIRKSFGVLEPYFNRRCLSMCSHRPVQHLLVCGSTDREYRWF
jgi:hypothetical protein